MNGPSSSEELSTRSSAGDPNTIAKLVDPNLLVEETRIVKQQKSKSARLFAAVASVPQDIYAVIVIFYVWLSSAMIAFIHRIF